MASLTPTEPLGLFIQPACLQHRYIRHPNSSHIFERPERLRAVLLGVAAAAARLEEADEAVRKAVLAISPLAENSQQGQTRSEIPAKEDDLSNLLSSLSINNQFVNPPHLTLIPPPTTLSPGQILLHHPALQLAHSPPPEAPYPYTPSGGKPPSTSSVYLKDLFKWASEALEKIKETGSEIPQGLGLNQGDLYLSPGSVLAIEGAIQTVCQAIDKVCASLPKAPSRPSTPSVHDTQDPLTLRTPPHQIHHTDLGAGPDNPELKDEAGRFRKAFCAIRPPGHHCGEDAPSGFCYVNNVVVGAMHGYLQHDIDRAIMIDFDLHHGNGTQALVMPLNAASHAEDMMVQAGKPPSNLFGRDGKRRRGWKGFYGSVHDIYSYPCEDGDLDLIKDASISLAGHGQYIENIHLQPYASEDDFYERIYPKYLALLDKARVFMEETQANASRTIVLISAGFDACEHEHQGMQRHDRRVPVSFFSRYTRDIASFADKYTEGKIVSVLEGGYSDRALTSAAMGHVIGMLGQDGNKGWWNEDELLNIEKATRKKRTGKLAPFPPELSSHPYLVRTHALLSHFEGFPETPTAPAASIQSGSTTTTPSQRMTLRDRRRVAEEEVGTTPPHPIARRGRGRATPGGTPAKRSTTANTAGVGRGTGTPDRSRAKEEIEVITPGRGDRELELAIASFAGVTLEPVKVETGVRRSPRKAESVLPKEEKVEMPLDAEKLIAIGETAVQPKIILRIPRPPSSTPPPIPADPTSYSFDPVPVLPPPPLQSSTLYPPLPPLPTESSSAAPAHRQDEVVSVVEGRYREVSSTPSGTSEEYMSAVSVLSDELRKEQ